MTDTSADLRDRVDDVYVTNRFITGLTIFVTAFDDDVVPKSEKIKQPYVDVFRYTNARDV